MINAKVSIIKCSDNHLIVQLARLQEYFDLIQR